MRRGVAVSILLLVVAGSTGCEQIVQQMIVAAQTETPDGDYPPLPPPATTVDDTLFRPVVPPATDPFGNPSVTVDRRQVARLLTSARYAELEAMLQALRDRAVRDIRYETDLLEAYLAFDRAEPELEPHLDNWLDARRGSSEVRVARARYYLSRAWDSRGTKYIRDTSREQIDGMRRFAAKAEHEAAAGLALDSANVAAHVIHLGVLRLFGSSRHWQLARDQALGTFPASFVIRSEAMVVMEPRWGGSYRRMDRFAQQAEPLAAHNPRLRALRGFSLAERGYTQMLADNYAAAVHYYNQALTHGEYWGFYLDRGRTYYNAKDYARALEDFVRAAAQRPQNPDVLELKAKTLYHLSLAVPRAPAMSALDRAIADLEVLQAIEPANEDAAEWLPFLRQERSRAGHGHGALRGSGGRGPG